MKKLILALLLVASTARAQYTNFAHHATASAGHVNGLPAATYPALCSTTAVLGNFIYFSGSCWQALATPADGTYSITYTAGVPSWTAAAGSTPSGTGFFHITSGVADAAAATLGTELTFSGGVLDITTNGVTNAMLAQGGANTIKGNNTSSTANEADLTQAQLAGMTATCATSPTTCESMFDDFTGNIAAVNTNPGDMSGWIVGNGAGAGAGIVAGSSIAVANHPGIAAMGTGTTGTTASCSLARGATSYPIILNGSEAMDWLVMIPVLSTTNDHFEVEVGIMLGGTTSALEATNGMFFEYTDSVNSGKWFFHSIKATAGAGTLDTTVTVVAGTWYHLKLIANSASSYQVIVNGTNAGNFTTAADIPIVALTPQVKIYCTNNTAASNKILDVDYFWWLQTGLSR